MPARANAATFCEQVHAVQHCLQRAPGATQSGTAPLAHDSNIARCATQGAPNRGCVSNHRVQTRNYLTSCTQRRVQGCHTAPLQYVSRVLADHVYLGAVTFIPRVLKKIRKLLDEWRAVLAEERGRREGNARAGAVDRAQSLEDAQAHVNA